MPGEIDAKSATDYREEVSSRFASVLSLPAGTIRIAGNGEFENLSPQQEIALLFKSAIDTANPHIRSLQEQQSVAEHLLRVYEEIVAAMK